MSTSSMKIHPLVAVAAGAVIVVSLVGTAALLDWLPGSRSDSDRPPEAAVVQPLDKAADAATNASANKAAAGPEQRAPQRQAPAPQGKHAAGPAHAPQHTQSAPPAPMTAGAPPQAMPPMPPVSQAAPVCASCGKVLGVRTVDVEAKPSGVGVVAGAVVGGLLGNQVGGGTGRTLATVAGAVGGGYAGNEIEKRTRKAAAYEVDVQFEDGSRRAFRYEAAPGWKPGDRVKVVDGTLAAR